MATIYGKFNIYVFNDINFLTEKSNHSKSHKRISEPVIFISLTDNS